MATISVPLTADRSVVIKYTKVVVRYTLSTRVLADSMEVSIPSGSTINGQALTARMTLDPKTYLVTVPDSIIMAGVQYNFSTYTINSNFHILGD